MPARLVHDASEHARVARLPCAETASMLFWALLASVQITMPRVDGWQTLERSPTNLDLAA